MGALKHHVIGLTMMMVVALFLGGCGGGGGGEQPPANQAPVADAGRDQSVDAGEMVTLDGTGSNDPDGTVESYLWRQTGGTSLVTLSSNSTRTATFAAPDGGAETLTFRLTVTDDDGATDTDNVTITVGAPPPPPPELTVDAVPSPADAGDIVTLSSQSQYAGGSIQTHMWTQIAGMPTVTLDRDDGATATFTAPMTTTDIQLTFRLKVTYDDGEMASADVTVPVNGTGPPLMCDAGVDQYINPYLNPGNMVVLSGTASDAGGAMYTYMWEQTGGTMVTLTGDDTAMAMFNAPEVTGTEALSFLLTCTDGSGREDTDGVTVTVWAGTFVSVSAGNLYSCGLRDMGRVDCWGELDTYSQQLPQDVGFDMVSAGHTHTCGIRQDDNTVVCRGGRRLLTRQKPRSMFCLTRSALGEITAVESAQTKLWNAGDRPSREVHIRYRLRGSRLFPSA